MKSDDPNYFDVRAKTYVRYVLDELKISPSKLAKDAGLAPTTLTRALNDPTHKYTLSTSTLGKIAKASGINFNPFFETNDYPSLSMVPFVSPNLYDETWGQGANAVERSETNNARMTLVIGEAASGVWKEERINSLDDFGALRAAIPGVLDSDQFALKVADDSGAPYVRKGEYALCKRRTPDDVLRHGDLVVVERWSSSPRMMELSIRRLFRRDGEEAHLRADNPDEKYSAAVVPRPDLVDTDAVKIVGIVEYAIREVSNEALSNEFWEMRRRKDVKRK